MKLTKENVNIINTNVNKTNKTSDKNIVKRSSF